MDIMTIIPDVKTGNPIGIATDFLKAEEIFANGPFTLMVLCIDLPHAEVTTCAAAKEFFGRDG